MVIKLSVFFMFAGFYDFEVEEDRTEATVPHDHQETG